MNSTVTSKFQTTIPREVREKLGISMHDALEWAIEKGKVTVYPVHKNFLRYRNVVKAGKGDISADIELARADRIKRFGEEPLLVTGDTLGRVEGRELSAS